jgi:hypothetical protein
MSSYPPPPDLAEHVRRALSVAPPASNPTPIVCDRTFEVARDACQLFQNAVESAACEVGPLMPRAACDHVLRALLREGIAMESSAYCGD